ncbi:hypothetical protein ABDK56_05705 [Sphingomonas sp. ASV193]|uniref:hypothetical protein n=1 Tax=Sphingomonas sp. ASV193 TaxID=3144405 RepID=UPI0032E8DA96
MNIRKFPSLGVRQRIALGGATLLALGAAGGAGAVSMTRPSVSMAPTVVTAAAKLPQSSGIVTVKGKVAEVYGDRFVVQDGSGKAMVDAGRDGEQYAQLGAPLLVQGRYDNGQLKADYLVNASGQVAQVGPPPRGPRGRPHGGPGGPGGPGRPGDPRCAAGGPPPPPPPGMAGPAGRGMAPPPPPPGAGRRGGPGAPPPPPGAGPAGQAMTPPPPPPGNAAPAA